MSDIPVPVYPPIYYYPTSKEEPEPKFSIGAIFNPGEILSGNFFIGATYQRISQIDKFYDDIFIIPWDCLQLESGVGQVINSQYTFNQNELKFRGDIYSLFAGYRFTDNLSAGLSFNGINYKKQVY